MSGCALAAVCHLWNSRILGWRYGLCISVCDPRCSYYGSRYLDRGHGHMPSQDVHIVRILLGNCRILGCVLLYIIPRCTRESQQLCAAAYYHRVYCCIWSGYLDRGTTVYNLVPRLLLQGEEKEPGLHSAHAPNHRGIPRHLDSIVNIRRTMKQQILEIFYVWLWLILTMHCGVGVSLCLSQQMNNLKGLSILD